MNNTKSKEQNNFSNQIDRLREGKKLLVEHKYKEALRAFDETLDKNENNSTLWAAKGILELKLEHYDKSEESFRIAIDNDPNDPYFWAALGYVLKIKSEYREAIKAYEKALEKGIKIEELLENHLDTIKKEI